MIDHTFSQLVNLEQVRELLESHNRLSRMAYGLFDANENNLIAVGWQDICIRFHRAHPITCLTAAKATLISRRTCSNSGPSRWSIAAGTT